MVDAGHILGYLELHCLRPCASTCAELVKDIVKLDAGLEAGINDGLHELTERLQEEDTLGVCVSLGDQDQDGPPQFLWNIPGASHIPDYVHDLHPPSRFGFSPLPIPYRSHGATS